MESAQEKIACFYLDLAELSEEVQAACLPLVPPLYRSRSRSCKSASAALQHLASGIFLSTVLGVHSDGDLTFSPSGKPSLTRGGLFFSISHDDALAVMAVARRPLGVDVEAIDSEIDRGSALALEKLYGRQALEKHRRWNEDPILYSKLWTQAEAFLKADGCGIQGLESRSLQEISHGWTVYSKRHFNHVVSCAYRKPFTFELKHLELFPQAQQSSILPAS